MPQRGLQVPDLLLRRRVHLQRLPGRELRPLQRLQGRRSSKGRGVTSRARAAREARRDHPRRRPAAQRRDAAPRQPRQPPAVLRRRRRRYPRRRRPTHIPLGKERPPHARPARRRDFHD
ncbi:hypothetical protein M885DRAFT_614636 [Pelagophyceae sp. CCMP2097]|nr:hypothetical protein M885DRAFT_614636 [Pelagophyceae sp. CCMP2097]